MDFGSCVTLSDVPPDLMVGFWGFCSDFCSQFWVAGCTCWFIILELWVWVELLALIIFNSESEAELQDPTHGYKRKQRNKRPSSPSPDISHILSPMTSTGPLNFISNIRKKEVKVRASLKKPTANPDMNYGNLSSYHPNWSHSAMYDSPSYILPVSVSYMMCNKRAHKPRGEAPSFFITLFDHFHKKSPCSIQRDVFISPIKALSIHLTLWFTQLYHKRIPLFPGWGGVFFTVWWKISI